MNKSKFVALFLVLAGHAATPALAQGYLGGSLGQARANENVCTAINNSTGGAYGAPGQFSCDRTGELAWGGYLGYKFNDYFALEGGYQNLGKLAEFSDVTGQRAWIKSRLVEAVGHLGMSTERLFVYLKGGGYYAKTSMTGSFVSYGYSYNPQWTIGVGASYNVFKHAGLRLEWQRFNNVGGKEVGVRTDVDAGMVGGYLTF